MHKKQKFSAFDIFESRSKEMWWVLYVTCTDIIAQVSLHRWSVFLFLDVPILKFKIINILQTDGPEIIILTACPTKN